MMLVITDLDGTLLDHSTYRPGPALGALRRLQAAGVEIVFCSAKTQQEQDHLRAECSVTGPYIVENGAAVLGIDRPVVHGLPYQEVRLRLSRAALDAGARVRGYGDMTDAEVAGRTGLVLEAAMRARARQFTETFVLEAGELALLDRAADHHGLRLQRGGRFLTAQGHHDKGMAVESLVSRLPGQVYTVGIGDQLNDADLLESVDQPMLVQQPGGTWVQLEIPGLARLPGIGPHGWALAADMLLSSLD